jgi:hypothetical protein
MLRATSRHASRHGPFSHRLRTTSARIGLDCCAPFVRKASLTISASECRSFVAVAAAALPSRQPLIQSPPHGSFTPVGLLVPRSLSRPRPGASAP